MLFNIYLYTVPFFMSCRFKKKTMVNTDDLIYNESEFYIQMIHRRRKKCSGCDSGQTIYKNMTLLLNPAEATFMFIYERICHVKK